MPTSSRDLKRKMKEARERNVKDVKSIIYPLPDLRGPGGNAFVLLGEARSLMREAGVSDTVQSQFHSEATSGDYKHLLNTISKWFTLAVAETKYVPVGDINVETLMPKPGEEYESWSEYDEANPQAPDTLDKDLEAFEESNENARRIAEVQDRINREVRQDLGLSDDEVVIVQVKKVKKP